VERATAQLQNATTVARTLLFVSPDSIARDSSSACDQLVSNYTVEAAADARLYALARRAEAETAAPSSSAPDRQLAKLYVEAGRKAGAGLDSAARTRAVRLFQRHSDLERDFGLALAADSTRIRIPLGDTAGLEPQLRAQLKPEGDSLVVPVDESTLAPFLKHQPDRDARRRFYVAFWRRGGAANVARLDSALAVRDTVARLLGFPSWAAYQLSTKMAKSPGRVMDLLGSLQVPLRRKAQAENRLILPLARRDGIGGRLEVWDGWYYFERLRAARYALDESLVQQYFPVDHVVPAVMALYGELLGVRFAEVTPAAAWAPDVRRFAVTDSATGDALGRLYLDLYPRPNKYGHFADFDLVPTFRRPDGSRQLPWTAVVGNWPAPAPGHPALLTHGDVVVFFHEFGHAMASLLNGSPYVTTGALRQDFVEAPSQMLENWMWQPAVLRRVSHHVGTGAALPDSLIRQMLALKHLTDGNDWGLQVFISAYDMTLHGASRPADPTAAWYALWPRYLPVDFPAGTLPEAGIPHFMGGYEAGYYGYLWAKVYAQDMFSRFEREGVLDPQAGRAYRDAILAPAGTEEPDTLVRRFLGRPVSYEAFYRELGLRGGGRTRP
jgi:thimet oligopeptidase